MLFQSRLAVGCCALLLALAACAEPPRGDVAVLRVRGLGEIRFRLLPDRAPAHVASFTSLARAGFYDNTTFHRVIPRFMIQGGDPNTRDADPANDGPGGPGYSLPAEFNDTPHRPGIVSMARRDDPNSAGSQFFIMASDSESWRSQLDGQYTVFGELISGQDVVDRIANSPRDARDRPLADVRVESVTIEPG